MRIVDACVVDRHAKKAGSADGFNFRVRLFLRTAEGLFPFINAEDHLRHHPVGLGQGRGQLTMLRQRQKDAALMSAFIRQMQQATALRFVGCR